MPPQPPVFTSDTFKFFRDLSRNNRKKWMDAHRGRYAQHVTQPFREMLARLGPGVLKLDPIFEVTGKGGCNFSRINRDIRFAKDKTPYRPQMYLQFSSAENAEGDDGQLYIGINGEGATVGFRIYGQTRKSTLGAVAVPRALANPARAAQFAKRLGKKYESYWYSSAKGEWTKNAGWPLAEADWKKIKGWVVRKKVKPAAVTRAGFEKEALAAFRDLLPLYQFTSAKNWK